MYSKKLLIFIIIIEIIMGLTFNYLKPNLESPIEKIIIMALLLIPILVLLCIIGIDNSIDTKKRVISIFLLVFILITFATASVLEISGVTTIKG